MYNKKQRRLSLIMLMVMLINIIPTIAFAEPFNKASDYGRLNVNTFADTNYTLTQDADIKRASDLLEVYRVELESQKSNVEKLGSAYLTKYTAQTNDIMRYEIIRANMTYTINLMKQQMKARNLKESMTATTKISDYEKILTESGQNEKIFGNYKIAYKNLGPGNGNVGVTTGDREPQNMIMVSDLFIMDPVENANGQLELNKDQKASHETNLSYITSMIKASTDITELSSYKEAEMQDKLEKLAPNIIDSMRLGMLVVDLHNALGLTDASVNSDGLKAHIDNNHRKLKELLTVAGIEMDTNIYGTSAITDPEDEQTDGEGSIANMKQFNNIKWMLDTKKNDVSDLYKHIFSWTANFTPFITNVNEESTFSGLTENAKKYYYENSQKRAVIYRAQGDVGVAQGLKEGQPYQYKILSLGEFLDTIEDRETVLFIENHTEKGADINVEQATSKNNSYTQDTGNAGKINTEETNSSSEPFGDMVENQTEQKEEGSDTSLFENALNKGTDFLNKIGGTHEEETKTPEKVVKFIGPVYATSGSHPKDMEELTDSRGSRTQNLDAYGMGKSKTELDRSLAINRLKGNTMNMNYMMIYNTLKDKNQLSSALDEDMNKPLYMDFIGNILTESGFVVVPAASNYTFYNYTHRLPMFNSMFLNSYPEVIINDSGTYDSMSKIEREKMVYFKSKEGLVRIGSLNREGTTVKNFFEAVPLWSKANFGSSGSFQASGYRRFTPAEMNTLEPEEQGTQEEVGQPVKTTSDGEVVGDFMDYITMFENASNPYWKVETTQNTSEDLAFVNLGIIMKAIDAGQERIVNLKKITTDGRSMEWRLMKTANYRFITETDRKMISPEILLSIAASVDKSTDGDKSTLVEYVSRDEELRTGGGITQALGVLFEGFNNNFLDALDNNYLLYTPKYTDKLLSGVNAEKILLQIVIITSMIGVLVYIIGLIMAIFRREPSVLKSMVFGIVAILVISNMTVFLMDPAVDLFFNRPAQALLKKEIPMYILEDIEQEDKGQRSNFFDKSEEIRNTNDPSIVVEKLNRNETAYYREQMSGNSYNSPFYLPALDNTPVNIIGDKVYLQGRDLKIGVKDMLSLVEIEDMLGSQNEIKMTMTYTGYPELAYYMPFFNITDSFIDKINSFTATTRPPYRTIQYRKGMSMTTGRVEDFFKSVVFISPEMLENHVEDLLRRYGENEYTRNEYTGEFEVQKSNEENPEDEEMIIRGEDGRILLDEGGWIKDGQKYNEKGELIGPLDPRYDIDDRFYFDNEIMPKAMSNELYMQLAELNNSVKYLAFTSGLDHRDWLGLKEVLLMTENEELFPYDTHEKIKENKWYPISMFNNMEEEKILRNIYIVNDRTRDFVLEKLVPISGKISDETLVKMTALYATMEYNKVFSTSETKLYPRYINADKISNSFTTKSTMIPQEDIFIGSANRVGLYLAREAGWLGLLIGSIDRILYFVRMMLRILVIKGLIIAVPFVALYIFISRKEGHTQALRGALTSALLIAFIYLLEILWFKVAYLLVNHNGSLGSMTISLFVQILLTILVVVYTKNIFTNIRTFGYDGYVNTLVKATTGLTSGQFNDLKNRVGQEQMYGEQYDDINYGSNLGGQEWINPNDIDPNQFSGSSNYDDYGSMYEEEYNSNRRQNNRTQNRTSSNYNYDEYPDEEYTGYSGRETTYEEYNDDYGLTVEGSILDLEKDIEQQKKDSRRNTSGLLEDDEIL